MNKLIPKIGEKWEAGRLGCVEVYGVVRDEPRILCSYGRIHSKFLVRRKPPASLSPTLTELNFLLTSLGFGDDLNHVLVTPPNGKGGHKKIIIEIYPKNYIAKKVP